MENEIRYYEAVVIGAGHAGCEAALALARKGHKTLLTTINLDAIAFLACNPSIGGTAKGQLVSEIDALGGEMGVNTDKTLLQIRMLNRGKGPAVHSLRAQADKLEYHARMKRVLENEKNLTVKQAEITSLEIDGENKILTTALGEKYSAKVVIICSGVYLNSRIIIGSYTKDIGPNGFANAVGLTDSLIKLGIPVRRFKTGTPARLNGNTIDFSHLEVQKGETDIQSFSFLTNKTPKNKNVCYLTYTNEHTHKILRDNLDKAPLFSGIIEGVGPRYCPSIEDKIVRFADKDRHQVFLEPEAGNTSEIYVQGVSTSMPAYIQEEMYKTIEGLEHAQIMRNAYAIEYDCIDATTLNLTLEHKKYKGLFFAGQVNGTSGYEEAAGQGIIAGINAALYLENCPQIILKRSDAYIGVLIDDIVTKGTNEPYRMMTSRAEYRLILRQDNADQRLTSLGYKVGLVTKHRYNVFKKKMAKLEEIRSKLKTKLVLNDKLVKLFESKNEIAPKTSLSALEVLKRPNINIFDINEAYHLYPEDTPKNLLEIVDTEVRYSGYIKQQQDEIEKAVKQEETILPEDIDYSKIRGIRLEAREKLNKIKPQSLGQASRISGVSPADIAVLTIFLKGEHRCEKQ